MVGDKLITPLLTELKKAGIQGLLEYEDRLRNNYGKKERFIDLLFEADTALMFSQHGLNVRIREKPDLQVGLGGEIVYAEVTHFWEKDQDKIDKCAMKNSEDLIPVGNLKLTEGAEAWEEIAKKAVCKVSQYKSDSPNILVIATNSDAVNGIILPTAVNDYNERASRDINLRKLNALLLIDQWISVSLNRNVYFYQTSNALVTFGSKLKKAIADIHYWITSRSIASIISILETPK
jgi:hypothetical protein